MLLFLLIKIQRHTLIVCLMTYGTLIGIGVLYMEERISQNWYNAMNYSLENSILPRIRNSLIKYMILSNSSSTACL